MLTGTYDGQHRSIETEDGAYSGVNGPVSELEGVVGGDSRETGRDAVGQSIYTC